MYREQSAMVELGTRVVCVWHSRREGTSTPTIVPDGCMDILWDGLRLRVAGPDRRPMRESAAVCVQTVGLRFRVGLASSVLLTPASALCDQRVELRELWGPETERLNDALGAASMADAADILQRAVWSRRASFEPVDRLVGAVVARLVGPCVAPELRTAALARELGVSERQLLRRTTRAVGYGPKLLARILRMQRVRALLEQSPRRSLATLAAELGFADQAHLAHDAAQLFEQTPSSLRDRAQARVMSDFDKTQPHGVRQASPHERDITRSLSGG